MILFAYVSMFSFGAGLIISFVSMQKGTIVYDDSSLWPKDIDIKKRPWGLKIKELKKVLNNCSDPKIQKRIKETIFLRRLGLFLTFVPIVTYIILS